MNLLASAKGDDQTAATQAALNSVLVECIADVSREMLGQNGADALLFHLHLQDEESTDVLKVHERLHELLSIGAYGLESVILEELYRRMHIPFTLESSSKPINFVELVRKAEKANSSLAST